MTIVSDLEQENVAPNNRAKKISAEIAQEILHAVANIKYGSIEIIIHDSKVVQIERREKNPNKLERIKPQRVEIYNFLNSLKISLQRLS